MSKRRYILKSQDLYNSSPNDFVLQKALQPKTIFDNTNQKAYAKPTDAKTFQCHKVPQEEKQNTLPVTHLNQSQNEFFEPFGNANQLEPIEQSPKDNRIQCKQKVFRMKADKTNHIPSKKVNTSIGFRSSLNKTQNIKHQEEKNHSKKSFSKQKALPAQNQVKAQRGTKLNFSESHNLTARSVSGKKKCAKLKISVQKQEKNENPNQNQIQRKQQCLQIDSIIAQSVQNSANKEKVVAENLTIKKEKQPLMNPYLKQANSQIHILQNELRNCQLNNKQLQQILASRQVKLDEQHRQSIRLYKQNKDLSDMIRQLEQLMHKKSIQHEKTLFDITNQLKIKQDQFKILEAERDNLSRKKDRLNEEISKFFETLKLKDAEILSQKQKEEFMISENKQLIEAYQKIKQELTEALKINQTERFFSELVQKSQEQTARNNLDFSTFRCSQCNKKIYGSENTCDELAKFHMNQKFKKHIKTYEEEVKYWKDEAQFMKTQHQHEIENIRTVLQCTFQKSLMEKESKFSQQIGQLKKTILIQQQLITNYKNVIDRRQKVSKQQKQQNQSQGSSSKRSKSIQEKKFDQTSVSQQALTSRSRCYLTDRQVIEQVLAEEQECRPMKINYTSRMKENNSILKDSMIKQILVPDDQNSILSSFKKKIGLSDSNFSSRITKHPNQKQRAPLEDITN